MGLFDAQNDTLNLDPKAVQQSLSRLNSMRASAPPPAPPEPEERGLFGETAAAVKRGGLQVVDMAGNIAKAFDPEGGIDIVRNAGAGLSNFARNRAAQPDVAESSYVKNHPVLGNIPKAMEMAVPSVGIPLAAAGGAVLAGASAPVTAAVGIGAPAVAFGVSQFQDTKERALDAGVSRAEASKAGVKTGLIEGGLEAASNLIPFSKAFKLAKPMQGTVLKSMFKAPTWKALGKKLAVDTAQIMGGEVSTEMGQAYLQAKVEKDAGIRPDANPWQEAKDVIGPTIGLSLITGGVVGGANKLSRVASQRALQNPGVHEGVRRSAMENVHAGLVDAENKGVAPAGSAANWRRNAEAAIRAKAPLVLSDDLLTTDRTAAQESHDEQAKNDALEALALAADPTNDLGVSDAVQAVNQRKAEEAVSRSEASSLEPVTPEPVTPEPVTTEPAALITEPAALITEPAALTIENETPAPDPFDSMMSTAVQDGGVALSKREEGPTPEMVQWAESNGLEFTLGKLMQNMEQRWWGLQPKQEPTEQVAPQKVSPSSVEQTLSPAPQEVSPSPVGQAQVAPQEPASAATHTPPPAGQYRQHVVQRDAQGRPLVVAVERPDGVVGLLNTKGGVTAAFENAVDPDHPYVQAYREAVARGEVEQGPAPNAAFVRGVSEFDQKLRDVEAMRITPRKKRVNEPQTTTKEHMGGPAEELDRGAGRNPVEAGQLRETETPRGQGAQPQNSGQTKGAQAKTKRTARDISALPVTERLAILGRARREKLVESKNTKLAESLNKIAAIFGHEVTLIKTPESHKYDGFVADVDPKHIYLVDASQNHPVALLGHEILHQMKKADKSLYYELHQALDGMKNKQGFKEFLDRTGEIRSEEWVADVFGHALTREGFWSEFEKASPSLAGRVATFIHDFIQKFKGKLLTGRTGLAAKTIKDFRKVDALAADVARRYAENVKRSETGEFSETGFKELSSVSSDDIPSHIVNAVAAPREVMTAVSTATKQQTKDTLNEKLKSREIPHTNPIRLTTVEELHDIIKTGTLRAGKDFEGRSGISAQLVDDKKPIVAYGPNDKISAAIVFPEQAAIGKGMAPNEVKVSEKTDVTDLHFVVDGFRELMSFDQLKEAMGEKQDAIGFKELTAWHGSPHDHDKFSMDKVGTGEGAQAYGHGLYFAGNREVAEWYRDKLTRSSSFSIDGKTVEDLRAKFPSDLWAALETAFSDGYKTKAQLLEALDRQQRLSEQTNARWRERYGEDRKSGYRLTDFPMVKAVLEAADSVTQVNSGRLYQVELAPQEDEYLLWDKPLSEQSEKVKAALRNSSESPDEEVWVNWTGEQLYTALSKDKSTFGGMTKGEAKQAASEYLHSLGIRGIKYLDGSSRSKGEGAYNFVIFADEDVTITFKELTSLNPVEQAKGINRAFRDIPYGRVLKDAMKSAYRFFMPMDRTVVLLASMANYKPIQAHLKQFLRQRKGKAGYLQSAMTNAHHVLVTMGKVFATESDEKKLADLAFTATLYQVHADPRMADGWTEDSWVTSGQDQVTGKSLGDARREVWSMYSKLTPKQKKAHRAMLDHFQHLRDDAKNHALDPVKQLFGDDVFNQAQQYLANEQQVLTSGVEVPQLVKDAAKAIKTKMQAFPELKGDYVPLMRFGNYQVRINEVDENGEMGKRTYAEFFDTKEDALRFIAGVNQNTATSGQMATLEVADDKLRRAHVNVPGSYADQIKDALQNKYKEALESGDADTQALIESMIEAAHDEAQAIRVNTLPRTTTEGSKLHREGVAGFSRDIVKVFATYSRNTALANSRLIYGEQINQTFRDMKNTIKVFDSEPSEPGQEKQHAIMSADMQDAYNWLYRMDKDGDQEKVHEFAQVLGKASAFWYLSSPSTWLVQWSQPFIFTVPHMAARFGFPKALAEYTWAAKRYLAGNYSDEKIDEFDRAHEFVGKRMADLIEQSRTVPERERGQINAELKSIYESFPDPKGRELLALKVLSHQNAVDLSAAHMVQDLTAGATDGSKTFDKLVNGSAWFMQKSESGSRRAAAVSSFKLAFEKDGDFLAANDYAVDTISKTLYDFDSSNRGEAWRGSWGRVFGIFRFFQLHTIGQLVQLSKDALGAEFKRDIAEANGDQAKIDDAKAKMGEARKELAYIMGSSFALAGALGTPLSTLFSNSAMNLIWAGLGLAFGDDDDPWDPRRDFEMMVRRNLNSTAADVVLKGLPSLVGADVSRRIGLGTIGDIINGEPPPGISSAQKFGWYAGRALGPAGGMVMDGVRVLDELEKGNLVEALRYGTPKGIRDTVKAFQVATDGVKSGGNTIMKGEDVSPYSFALMFMGVNPLDVSLAQEESRYLKNISAVLSQRRAGLVKDLAEAVVNQDEDAKEAAIEEINGWQQAHPKLQITMQNVVQAIKRRQRAEDNIPTRRERIIQEEYGMEGGEDGGEM